MAFKRAVAAVLLALAFGANAAAQSLQRLTVTQLVLSADTSAPMVENPFHLIVTATVKERVKRLDNIVLPILTELELLGDEQQTSTDRSGTHYRETITVVAHHTGNITIAPVTLDAVNARTGRAERYSSNSLNLNVGGTALAPASPGPHLWSNLAIAAGFLAVSLLSMVLVARRWRAPPAPLPEPEPAPLPVARPHDPRSDLRDALATLRVHRTRETAVAVRLLVRRMVGAGDAETLEDVLQRPQAANPVMRELLRALERASFTHDGDLESAIAAALVALERAAS
jgi:hypothetical protein